MFLFQEYSDNRGVALRVDRENGIIQGVKLLGTVSKKGREYPRAVMAKALSLYEGQRVNIDHVEPGQRRSLRDRIGLVKNVTLKEDGLYGDFHFNPKHALAEQIAWDAENAPQNLGFSHDTRGFSRSTGGKMVVESIDKVLSVDLVANPATTTGLFESTDSELFIPKEKAMDSTHLTVQELREAVLAPRDDLVKTILTEADEGKEISDLKDRLKTLQATLDDYKAAEAHHALQEAITGELKAAGLDPANTQHVSEIFLEDLAETIDPIKRKAKIDDRKQLVGTAKPANGSAAPSTGNPLQESHDAGAIPPASASIRQRIARFVK